MARARRVHAATLAAVVVLTGAWHGREPAPAAAATADSAAKAQPIAAAASAMPSEARPAFGRTGHWIPFQVRQRL